MTWRAGPILCTILLACTAAVFLPARNFAFVNWDDFDEVTENPLLHPPTAEHLRQIWSGPYLKLYAPLTYTAWWALERVSGGDNPYAFHLLNVALHLGCAALVFSILRLCVKSPAAAFGGAIVFALHPMQVESVGWVAEMNNLLAAALSLAAIRLYLASATTPSVRITAKERRKRRDAKKINPHFLLRVPSLLRSFAVYLFGKTQPNEVFVQTPRRHWLIYALASAAYLAALFSKPTAVVVPLMAVILDSGVLRRPLRPAIYALLPWAAAAGVFGWIARQNQGGIALPLLDRLMVALDAMGFYGQKILWPVGLTIDYGRTPGRVLLEHGWMANAGIAVAMVVIIWLLQRRYRAVMMGAMIALAALLPVLGFVPFAFQEISTEADHFMYLAMLGPALAAAALLSEMRQRAILPVAAAAGLILAALSMTQLNIWQSSKTLIAHTLAIDAGSAVGNSIAGSELNSDGHPEQAIACFLASLARDPTNPYVQYNLANALASVGKYDQAIKHFQIAIAIFDPPSWRAFNNLGIVYAKTGRRELAMMAFKRALEIDPHNPQVLQNLRILAAGTTR